VLCYLFVLGFPRRSGSYYSCFRWGSGSPACLGPVLMRLLVMLIELVELLLELFLQMLFVTLILLLLLLLLLLLS